MKRLFITTLWITFALTTGCQRPPSTASAGGQPNIPLGDHDTRSNRDLDDRLGADMGGVDGGGGTSYRGRPVDSYRVDILKKPEDAAGILAAIDRIAQVNPMFAAVMMHIVRERSWIMIPGDLHKIPSIKMGIHVETDQVAIHKMREIWINSRLLDEMSPVDRQTLLVHEIVMGVRFMEFTTALDRCIARNSLPLLLRTDSANAQFQVQRKKCISEERNRLLNGGTSELLGSVRINDADNAMIRGLTALLMDPNSSLPDSEELELWLIRSGISSLEPQSETSQESQSYPDP